MDILSAFPVRKSKQQKQEFRDAAQSYLKQFGYSPTVEKGSFGCRNMVIGDPETAQYLSLIHILEKLSMLATGEFTMEKRMMLDVTVQRSRDILFHDICLNDAVITKGVIARIVHLSVKCDGIQAMECGGDGVIVATPTGSTAYSLSAGGPIVEPEANNIIITPICAHEVGSRCIVASDRRVVTVEMVRNARRNAYVLSLIHI